MVAIFFLLYSFAFLVCKSHILPKGRTSSVDIPSISRLFEPAQLVSRNLNKASAGLRLSQCPADTIIHHAIGQCTGTNMTNVHIIPHSSIYQDGEQCGTGNPLDYTLMVPGEKLIDARAAALNGFTPLYNILRANERAFNAFDILGNIDPIHIAFEYTAPRICGGEEKYSRDTIYFLINPSIGKKDLNFGFAYLGVSELGLVSLKTNEELCLYKQTRYLGPGQSPFATPTPSPIGIDVTQEFALQKLQNPPGMKSCLPLMRVSPTAGPPLPSRLPDVSFSPSPTYSPMPSSIPSPIPSPSSVRQTEPTKTPAFSSTTPLKTPKPSASPTTSLSPTPTRLLGEDIINLCFPSQARVQVESEKKTIRISELRVGDKVLVEGNKYSEVFLFTHHMKTVRSKFIRISTASGASLALSPNHYIPVSGRLHASRKVTVGQNVTLSNGQLDMVISVTEEVLWGLHNPQTMEGSIIVDGIVASTFTESIQPSTAFALLSPIKLLYSLRLWNAPFQKGFAQGSGLFARMLPNGPAVL